jgi:hypothetical protein
LLIRVDCTTSHHTIYTDQPLCDRSKKALAQDNNQVFEAESYDISLRARTETDQVRETSIETAIALSAVYELGKPEHPSFSEFGF